MTLAADVQRDLGVSEHTAERALGLVFRAVRMTMHGDQFNDVREAFPHVEEWLDEAPVAGGRTAEMLAIVGPEELKRSLEAMGFEAEPRERLYHLVAAALTSAVPALAVEVQKKLPMLT